MNWQVQPSSNASVVPGGGIRFIDVSGEVVRIDGPFLQYGRGLVNDFRKSRTRARRSFSKRRRIMRIYGRVCGWRAKHAVSLSHWICLLVAWVRAGAEVAAFPSACFGVIQKV